MKLFEAIELLGKVHNGNGGRYIEKICNGECDGEYTMGMRRKSKLERVAVMREFWGDDENIQPFDFGECDFLYTNKDGNTSAFPFECADFLADDWECLIIDCDGYYDYNHLKFKVKQTFAEFLLDSDDDTLIDYDSAVAKIKAMFAKAEVPNLVRVDITSALSDCEPIAIHKNAFHLMGMGGILKDWVVLDELEKLGYRKDDLFEIEITFENGEEVNLAEWEVQNEF